MANTVYVGLALSDSMFPVGCNCTRLPLQVDAAKAAIARAKERGELVSCCNSSHVATLTALKTRFGIELDAPAVPPKVKLQSGDKLIVFSTVGLQRLTDRHEYTEAEIAGASFVFGIWIVQEFAAE